MPVTYHRATSTYQITCRDCDRIAHAHTTYNGEAIDAMTGARIADTFRFHGTRGAWLNRCRRCENHRNAERRTARGPRVPGTTAAIGAALGIARPFGVEFECGLPTHIDRATLRAALAAEGATGLEGIKGDGSIHIPGMTGIEVVSPALRGPDGEEQVRKVSRVLNRLGAKVNRSCGTHVHHDIGDLTVDQIKRTARAWFNNQPIINGLVSESRREGGSFYCRPLSTEDIARIENIRDLAGMRGVMVDRYRTLNLTSYGRHGTVEIRQHQGTLDAEKVISWLRLGQAIIDTAKAQTTQVAPCASVRDLFTALASHLNETARTFLIGRAVEFDTVPV